MPYIHSKVSIETTPEQRQELKTRLGQAIAVIPGKSEAWLMVNLEDNQEMSFGSPDPEAFQKMTEEITKIYNEVLGIRPDHMYIKYDAGTDWGWNGNNF